MDKINNKVKKRIEKNGQRWSTLADGKGERVVGGVFRLAKD
jgi:hypothetical protein